MTKVNIDNLVVTEDTLSSYKRMVSLLSDVASVEYAAIWRYGTEHSELCSSTSSPLFNGWSPDSILLSVSDLLPGKMNGSGLPGGKITGDNLAFQGSLSSDSPGKIKPLYYSGHRIYWPDGTLFGVMLAIDSDQSKFNEEFNQLLSSFGESARTQLQVLYQQSRLNTLTQQLRIRSDNRTKDIASLNFTLSQEIDKRKAAEQEVMYHKNHDIGTGFLNQYALLQSTGELIRDAQATSTFVAVIHITFTNGRKIQERYGDQALSELLVAFRERIGSIDCIESVTARTSVSNFVVALRCHSLTPFIDNFCYRCLELCHSDFVVEKDRVHLHGFIGVATSIDSTDANDLIYFANEAAFSCKETGSKYSYYSETHTEQRMHTNQIESYLLQAVRNDDLKLYYQPKVDLKTGDWVGAEALIRWNHPILGSISNENLIQLAEQNGLIFEVGNFVLRSAIESASEWLSDNQDFRIAVNVSAVQLKSEEFIDQVEHLLETYHFPASRLEIELTESCLISDEYLARQTLDRLHKLGVTLSLDDFGTGCASFSYLKNYPFNSLKIDKSFVQNLTRNANDKAIVRSIVQIAKKLHLDVAIEGVENIDQERFVLNEGCDFAQGFLYGKPMTSEEFGQCIAK